MERLRIEFFDFGVYNYIHKLYSERPPGKDLTMTKKMKAVLSFVLCAAILFAAAAPAFAAVNKKEILRFNEDGKFKIMQIADTQDTDTPKEAMLMFLEKALDAEKPDLVVFTGDQIAGGKIETAEGVYEAIRAIVQPVVDRGIPFTVTFGNHDSDDGCPVSRDDQLKIYQSFPGCLAYDADPELYGTGTHNLPIYASDSNEIKFNLWLIDSNDYDRVNGGYDYVHEDQIAWYERTSRELEEQEGHLVPSIVFQHIIVPEVGELLLDATSDSGTSATKVINGEPKVMALNPKYASGLMLEFPCPSDTNSGQFASWAERGDVIAAAFGHDHINSFIGTVDGIDLVMAPGVTFQSYGRYITRAVRTFTLDENDPWNYETDLYKYTDAFGIGLYSWFVGAYYGDQPAMWIPIVLVGVGGAAVGAAAVSAVATATAGVGAAAIIIALVRSRK